MNNFKITKTILENINEQNDRINECVDIVNGYTTDEETRVVQELQRQQNELRREEQYSNIENRFTTINEQVAEVNEQLDNIVQYNLVKYCNDINKTDDFVLFMNNLSDTENKTLYIPKNHTLILNKNFTIPSNTCIEGGGEILFKDVITLNNLYNPSLVADKWGGSENITIKELTIKYILKDKGGSILRFRNVDNLNIYNTRFIVDGDYDDTVKTSHNAIIDLFKGCTNVNITNNRFDVTNKNSTAGGCIWVRNSIVAGNDEETLNCTNINIDKNVFKSNACDEIVGVFGTGDLSNVNIMFNTFIRENQIKNVMLAVYASKDTVNIKNISIYNNTFKSKGVPTLNPEILRIGFSGQNIGVQNVDISNNNFDCELIDNSCISVIGTKHIININNNNINNNSVAGGGSNVINCDNSHVNIINNTISNTSDDAIRYSTKAFVFNNKVNNKKIGVDYVTEKSFETDGFMKYSNGFTEQWGQLYIDVNNGGAKTIELPFQFTKFLSASVVVQNGGASYDGKSVTVSPAGVNRATFTNYSSSYVTIRYNIKTLT